MTREQRDSILKARGTKRNISKIETNEDATEQGNPNGSGTDPAAYTPTGGAGDEFGRQSRRRTNYIGMMKSSSHEPCNVESRIISYTDKSCQVAPYHPDYANMKDIPIVQAGTAFDDPNTGETIILVINQGLYFGDKLPNSLINQIIIPEYDIRSPLSMNGVISYEPVRKPSIREHETCRWINLTSDMEWDPHSEAFELNEKLAQENDLIAMPQWIPLYILIVANHPIQVLTSNLSHCQPGL